jgi:hypothetical protein
MTPAQLDIARNLVRSPHWRWLSGCRWRFDLPHHADLWNVYEGPVWIDDDGIPGTNSPPSARGPVVPDLSDPATIGCLAAIACAAWAPKIVYIRPSFNGRWYVVVAREPGMGGHLTWIEGNDSPGEAWAALILAAPERLP